MLRRHLLFFLTGALLALAAVAVIRAGDDGSAAGSAGQAGPGSTSTTPTTTTVPRSVRLRTHRRVLRDHRREESPAALPAAKALTAPTPAHDKGGSGRPRHGDSGTEPGPGTSATPATTVPDDTTETVPDAGGQTTAPAPETGTAGAGADTPPPDPGAGAGAGAGGGAGVTIPNAATPDASVAP